MEYKHLAPLMKDSIVSNHNGLRRYFPLKGETDYQGAMEILFGNLELAKVVYTEEQLLTYAKSKIEFFTGKWWVRTIAV